MAWELNLLYIQFAGDETTDELDLEELESALSQDDLTRLSMAALFRCTITFSKAFHDEIAM